MQMDTLLLLVVDNLQRPESLLLSFQLVGTNVQRNVSRINGSFEYQATFQVAKAGSFALEMWSNGLQVKALILIVMLYTIRTDTASVSVNQCWTYFA